MPKITKKRKKQDSSDEAEKSESSTDSGPDDVLPPKKGAASKSAVAKKVAPASNTVGEDEEPSWQLDRNRIVKVRKWKGSTYIDVREYYEKDGKTLPGKKGYSFSMSQWKKFVGLIPEIEKSLEDI